MKKILIVAIIFAMLTSLASCGQKTHFKFEKIRNVYFREKTQFFAFNDLIYVIDRDKLVCMNPDNGEMLESVNLPGYFLDIKSEGSNLYMTFKSGDGFIFKDFGLNGKSSYITEKRSFIVEGTKFLYAYMNIMVLYDDSSRTLASYKNGKLAGKLVFEKPCSVEATYEAYSPGYAMCSALVYDGQTLTFAGFDDNWRPVYPVKEMPQIKLPSKNFNKSMVVRNDFDAICVYDGESFNFVVTDDNYKTYKINKVNFPNLESFTSDALNIYASNNYGLFIIDYVEPTRISNGKFELIDLETLEKGSEEKLPVRIHLLGMRLGKSYRVECVKTNGPINLIRGNEKIAQTCTFDELPEGTFCAKFARMKEKMYVYAFTSEGLFRSEPLE